MFINNIIITDRDDISCSIIPNCSKIILDNKNIKRLYDTIEEHKNKNNIIIDSRCVEFIIYSFFKYTVDIYIYNVINNKIENVFIWVRNIIKYNVNVYNIVYMKKILFLYLFYNYYMRFIPNKPFFQPSEAHRIISKTSSDIIDINFILEFINKPYTTNDFNNNVYEHILHILNLSNLDNIEQFEEFVTLANIQAALSMLVSMDYVLKL